jgi:hypothetical protein
VKSIHGAIAVMAGVHILLGTAGIWLAVEWDLTDEILGPPLLMLAPGQGSLLALWAAFGGKGSPWRSVLALLVLVAHYAVNDRWVHSSDMEHWLGVQLLHAIPFLFACLLARLLGIELRRGSRDLAASDSPAFRFSVGRTIAWVTAIGITIGVLQILGAQFGTAFGNCEGWSITAATGFVAVASFWLPLGQKRFVLRLLALAVAISLGTFVLREGVGYLSMEWFALLLVIEAIWITGSLIVVRLAGYRWAWRRRFRRPRDLRPADAGD